MDNLQNVIDFVRFFEAEKRMSKQNHLEAKPYLSDIWEEGEDDGEVKMVCRGAHVNLIWRTGSGWGGRPWRLDGEKIFRIDIFSLPMFACSGLFQAPRRFTKSLILYIRRHSHVNLIWRVDGEKIFKIYGLEFV